MHSPDLPGRLAASVLTALRGDPDALPAPDSPALLPLLRAADRRERLGVLWTLQELHRGGFDDVDDAAECAPPVLALRRHLERELELRLRSRWDAGCEPLMERVCAVVPDPRRDIGAAISAMVDLHEGRSLARAVQRDADRSQACELLRLRSIYHLQESDPVAWIVPRVPVRAKAALMALQFDEYGAGDPSRLHHHLFALGLAESGLDDSYGAYLAQAPAEILEQVTTVTMLGLQRRLRGVALGHLAAFEATSAVPSRQMAQGLERLGFGPAMVEYYREHVVADAAHEQLAARTICGSLVEDEPRLTCDVLLGAWTCLDLEDRLARWLLPRWGLAA